MKKLESVLKSKGKELSRIEEMEPEPSLGNGGRRLAACFMDSVTANPELPAKASA